MSDFTPGPWGFEHCAKHSGYHVRTDKEGGIALVNSDYASDYDNARLIAAAPDLLAACEAVLDMFEQAGATRMMAFMPITIPLKDAIAKARGQ